MKKISKYDLKSPPKFRKNLTTAFLYPLAGLNYEASKHPDFHLYLYLEDDQTHSLVFQIRDEEMFQE